MFSVSNRSTLYSGKTVGLDEHDKVLQHEITESGRFAQEVPDENWIHDELSHHKSYAYPLKVDYGEGGHRQTKRVLVYFRQGESEAKRKKTLAWIIKNSTTAM